MSVGQDVRRVEQLFMAQPADRTALTVGTEDARAERLLVKAD